MKKILKYALMAVLAVAVVLPMASKVEAATVAIVPLIVDESVKDEDGMNSMLSALMFIRRELSFIPMIKLLLTK